MDTSEIRSRVAADMPRITRELADLVSIPSVSLPGHDAQNVRRSAEATRDALRAAGVADAHLVELSGAHPAVAGRIDGPDGAPTVLLYAHHDVQPTGSLEEWRSPPFEPVVRGGRMFGRGSSDDKVGVVVHAAALRALGAHEGAALPVTVKLIVEGEEEATAEHLPDLFDRYSDLLRADVAVICDGVQDRDGVPTIESSVRGVVDCVAKVTVLERAQHSGIFGGPVPDALTALCRMLATLHDDNGDVAIAGLRRHEWNGTPVSEQEFRSQAGVLPSVSLIGTSSIASRLYSSPAVSVLGIDCPSILESSNQLVATASARVSLRLAPDEDPKGASTILMEHLKSVAPWGVRVEVSPGQAGGGYSIDGRAPAFGAMEKALAETWGAEVATTGSGGTIPFVPLLAEAFPGIAVLITGAADKSSYFHSIDESVDLTQVELLAVSEAVFIRDLASTLQPHPE